MNAETFNVRYKVGTPVFAYPGARPEDIPSARRLVTRTRTEAQSVGLDREGVVWVDGHGAYIALTHVDVVSESVWKAAKTAEAVASEGALPRPVGPDWETAIRTAIDGLQGTHHDVPPETLQAVTERLIESLGKYVLVPKWEYELLEGQRDRATRAEERIAELEGVTIDSLHRKVDSLKAQQAQDDAEYATAIAERDRARAALREACDQIAKLESDLADAMAEAASLKSEAAS